MRFEKKRILITVKAYPNPSRKYTETVCTAGIDLTPKRWIRLYPIPFRDLEFKKRFKKYDIIEAQVKKAQNDSRPESYNVECDSINFVTSLSTQNSWKSRKDHILPLLSNSMCEIEEKCKKEGISLGLFRPRENVGFSWEPIADKWEPEVERRYAQLSMFNPQKKVLGKIPYIFRFEYFCENESRCKGHNQCIVDWEIGGAYRSWKQKYRNEEKTLEMIKNKWRNEIFGEKRDTYFFVGNQFRFRTFMILGIFWPPKK